MIFSHIFLSILINIGSFFIYRKNTNGIKIHGFRQNLKNCFFLFSCIQLSLSMKNHIIFSYNKNSKNMYQHASGFNNQFIKVTRTMPIFQKTPKKNICFLLISGIMNLFVKHTPDIKKIVFLYDVSMVRFLFDKIRIFLQMMIFFKPQTD